MDSEPKRKKIKISSIDDIIDSIQWENRVSGEPLDLVSGQLWNCPFGPSDHCKICNQLDNCYEVTYEWGDTKKYEYFSELCSLCYHRLYTICRNIDRKLYYKNYSVKHPFEKECEKCNGCYLTNNVKNHDCKKYIEKELVPEIIIYIPKDITNIIVMYLMDFDM